MAHDHGVLLCLTVGREGAPSAAVLDSRTMQSSRENRERAYYDTGKRRKGSKIYMSRWNFGQPAGPACHAHRQNRAAPRFPNSPWRCSNRPSQALVGHITARTGLGFIAPFSSAPVPVDMATPLRGV